MPCRLRSAPSCSIRTLPSVAVCGDGGFAMSMHGLMTAVEEQLPIGVVVFNNRALGWVLHGMGEEVVAAEFADFDIAEIARSLGCDGVRPRTIEELEAAFARLSTLDRPLVIDVPVNLAYVVPRHARPDRPAPAGQRLLAAPAMLFDR